MIMLLLQFGQNIILVKLTKIGNRWPLWYKIRSIESAKQSHPIGLNGI